MFVPPQALPAAQVGSEAPSHPYCAPRAPQMRFWGVLGAVLALPEPLRPFLELCSDPPGAVPAPKHPQGWIHGMMGSSEAGKSLGHQFMTPLSSKLEEQWPRKQEGNPFPAARVFFCIKRL